MSPRPIPSARTLLLRTMAAAIVVAAPLRAQTIDWTRVHDVTMRGINLLYNLEMDRALSTFDSVTAMAPGDPRGRFFRSMVHFWTYTLRNDERDFDRFMAYSDTVVGLCEQLVERNANDAVARFYLGGIHGYRGLAHQLHGSLLKAVMEGREGYSQLEEAVRLRPDLPDAHMGFGLFRYLVAKIPSGFSWVVNLLGFEGDLEGGLQSLRYAADHGVYTKSEASFFLSQFLYNERKNEEAFERMRTLIARHPDNTLFLVLYASWQFRLNNLDEALDALRKASVANDRKTIRYGEEFIHSTRGSISFTRNDFAAARTDFDIFLQKNVQPERVPNRTLYRIAVARDIMGDRAGAVAVCGMMKRVNDEDSPNETYYSRKGRELAERPLAGAEILLVRAVNAQSRMDLDSAAAIFRVALAAAGGDADVRVRALYGLQQIFRERQQDADAVAMGEEIASLNPVREMWIVPHSLLVLGQSYARMGQREMAFQVLQRVEDFDDYDFQKSLEERVEEELANLNSNGTGKR